MIDYGFKVFNALDKELIKHWQKLYAGGANYNLSPEWCNIWLKHFGQGKKLYIITYWESKELKLLAPLYIRRGKLVLIGTKPDMYDEFNILYDTEKNIKKFVEYLIKNRLDIEFKHLNTQSLLAKHLIKEFNTRGIYQLSQTNEAKPCIFDPNSIAKSVKNDVNRCLKKIGQDLSFEFQATPTQEDVDKFIEFHTNRWNGGMLVKKKNLVNFIKDVVMNCDSVVFSKLKLTETQENIAYGIGYMDSAQNYCYSMTAYKQELKPYSPGKILLSKLINDYFANNKGLFDFGRGSETYKYDFADNYPLLFSITTYNDRRKIKFVKFLRKIMR